MNIDKVKQLLQEDKGLALTLGMEFFSMCGYKRERKPCKSGGRRRHCNGNSTPYKQRKTVACVASRHL